MDQNSPEGDKKAPSCWYASFTRRIGCKNHLMLYQILSC